MKKIVLRIEARGVSIDRFRGTCTAGGNRRTAMQTHLEMTPSIPHKDTATAPVADVASAAPGLADILIHNPSAAIATPRQPASPWYSDPAASRGM
jgi:hypothetical protein